MGTHTQFGTRTNILCPICGETGGSLQKKWSTREPHVPKLETITNLSSAWDYAANVLLRLRETFILFPPDTVGHFGGSLVGVVVGCLTGIAVGRVGSAGICCVGGCWVVLIEL